MAILALQSASSALSALNSQLDVVSNNLANINTPGFKKSRVNFQDLLYLEREQPGIETGFGDERPTGLYVGLGVKASGTQVSFSQGAPITTGEPLDVLIDGLGFFQVSYNGDVAYSRAGNFTLNSRGEIVLATDTGRLLDPSVTVPNDAESVSITGDGRIIVTQPGNPAGTEIGQIQLAAFVNPAGLEQVGENLFAETGASGAPIVGNPAEENRGTLRQGFLEASNVDPTTELIELIRTQRAFEFNSQSIQAADDALSATAQLRR